LTGNEHAHSFPDATRGYKADAMSETELIEEVSHHELLWDPKNKDYQSKHQRELIWSVFQKKLGPATGEF
jgi:hypothetical protein